LFGAITTDSYDSIVGPYAPGGVFGDVATNGDMSTANTLTVGGHVRIAGNGGLTSNNTVTIKQALHSNGPVTLTSESSISTDGYVNGTVSTATKVDFGGTLTQPAGTTNAGMVTANAFALGEINITPPCPCDNSAIIPVGALMMDYSLPENNDNAAVGLEASLLQTPGGPKHLQLPCGVFYLSGISNTAAVTITTTGNTALFIDGDIDVSGMLHIHPLPGAQLDIFTLGSIKINGNTVLGSPNYPAATRIYIGGNGPVTFANSLELSGFLYSDQATVSVNNALDIYGGLSVYKLQTSNTLVVHYDSGAQQLSEYCPAP